MVTSAHPPAPGLDARRLGQVEMGDTLAARNTRLAPGDAIAVRIRRSDGSGKGDEFAIEVFGDELTPHREEMLRFALGVFAERDDHARQVTRCPVPRAFGDVRWNRSSSEGIRSWRCS